MSREVAFEVAPSEPLRITTTLDSGQRVEILLRLAVVAVTDHQTETVVGGRRVPSVNVNFQPIIGVRTLDEEPPPIPGVSVTSGLN